MNGGEPVREGGNLVQAVGHATGKGVYGGGIWVGGWMVVGGKGGMQRINQQTNKYGRGDETGELSHNCSGHPTAVDIYTGYPGSRKSAQVKCGRAN